MLFNCFECGKTISSKKTNCVYCKTDVAMFVAEITKSREKGTLNIQDLKEKYSGTLLSFIMKGKPRGEKM